MSDSGKPRFRHARKALTASRRRAELDLERQARARAERALWQYWNLLDAMLAVSPDLFSVKNTQCIYQAASRSFCEFAAQSEREIRGKSDFDVFPQAVAEAFHRYDKTVLSSGRPYVWEETVRRMDARYLLRVHKTPLFSASGICIGLFCAARDVTDARRAEEQNQIFANAIRDGFMLLDVQGNILDVNQVYCEISGYTRAEMIGKNLHEIEVLATPEELSLRQRRIIESGWDRCKTLHRSKDNRILEFDVATNYLDIDGGRFYRFFREAHAPAPQHALPTPIKLDKGPPRLDVQHCKVINLNDIVRQALTLQAETLPPGIRVRQDLDPGLAHSVANPPQILQVLMNLITNAAEAIDDRGEITIRTRNIQWTEDLARAFPQLESGRYVFLAVEDTGRGISQKLIGKIFEPFITTKFRGRGMGLASAYRNVKDHGGHISVKSKEGHGCVFSVYFPATEETPELPASCRQIPAGTETILLIEPEAYAREEARKMLEDLAYRVITVQDLEEAKKAFKTHAGEIHAVLLDTCISGSHTMDLLAQLRRIRPGMRVLLAGSHDLNEETQDLLDAGADTFIAKPFRVDVLAPKLRQILDA